MGRPAKPGVEVGLEANVLDGSTSAQAGAAGAPTLNRTPRRWCPSPPARPTDSQRASVRPWRRLVNG